MFIRGFLQTTIAPHGGRPPFAPWPRLHRSHSSSVHEYEYVKFIQTTRPHNSEPRLQTVPGGGPCPFANGPSPVCKRAQPRLQTGPAPSANRAANRAGPVCGHMHASRTVGRADGARRWGVNRIPSVSLYPSLLLLEGRARRSRPERTGMAARTRTTCRPSPDGGVVEAQRPCWSPTRAWS